MHVVIWLLFLSLPALFKPHGEHLALTDFIDDLFQLPRLINSIYLVLVFYINYKLLIPRLFFRKRIGYFISTIVIALGLLMVINAYLIPHSIVEGANSSAVLYDRYEHGIPFLILGPDFNLFMFICVYFFAFALSSYDQWKRTVEGKLHTEIAFLKAQINPHFLFNTLNSIYSLALVKSDDTADAVVKLSAIMRYSLKESQKQYVNLAEEISYISNYTELQKLRLTDSVKLEAIYTGDFKIEKNSTSIISAIC